MMRNLLLLAAGSAFALVLVTIQPSLGAQLFPWNTPTVTQPVVVTETPPPMNVDQLKEYCTAAKATCINGCYSTLTQCTWNSAQVHAACIAAVQNRLPGPYPTDPTEAIRLCDEAREAAAANCHLAKDNCIRGC